jgi:glc operon protein GlcG
VEGLREARHLSLELALALLERVRTEAAQRELALAAAVVDGGGHVLASQRMDGAALGAMDLALGKAYTSVLWGTPTGAFSTSTQPGGDDWGWNTTDPRIVVYAGGIPLVAGGMLVGGLGASGASAAEDEECVLAAAAALGFDR